VERYAGTEKRGPLEAGDVGTETALFPYWVLFSIFAFGAITHVLRPRGEKQTMTLLYVAVLVLMLMVGLRYKVGADWKNYEEIYRYLQGATVPELLRMQDPAYMLLNHLAQTLNLDVWFVNLCCAALFSWGLLRFAEREPNPWLTIAVGVPYLIIVVGMGYTRQATAIAIVMASLREFEDHRYFRTFVLFVLAASFHKSAILIIPLIVASSLRHRFAIYSVGAALAALLFFVFLDQFVDTLFSNYLDAERSSQGAGIRIAMNLLPAVLFLTLQSRFAIGEQERQLWRNFSLATLATVAGLVLISSSTAVDRLALYLIPLQLFVMGRLPYAFPARGRRSDVLVFIVLLYSALVQIIWLVLAQHAEYWLPYQTVIPNLLG